eukprot:Tbor_TRINITY_DN4781_c0_g1::TRINITY_DN4781_c0_g1_i1::g.16906::m.16906
MSTVHLDTPPHVTSMDDGAFLPVQELYQSQGNEDNELQPSLVPELHVRQSNNNVPTLDVEFNSDSSSGATNIHDKCDCVVIVKEWESERKEEDRSTQQENTEGYRNDQVDRDRWEERHKEGHHRRLECNTLTEQTVGKTDTSDVDDRSGGELYNNDDLPIIGNSKDHTHFREETRHLANTEEIVHPCNSENCSVSNSSIASNNSTVSHLENKGETSSENRSAFTDNTGQDDSKDNTTSKTAIEIAKFTLRLLCFKLIETATDHSEWCQRAQQQWEGPLSIRLTVGGGKANSGHDTITLMGITPPRHLQFVPFPGIAWGGELSVESTFSVPLETSPELIIEVMSLAKPPGHVLGLLAWDGEEFLRSSSHFLRNMVHVFPLRQGMSDVHPPVHAVLEFEVMQHTTDLDSTLTPLSCYWPSPLQYPFTQEDRFLTSEPSPRPPSAPTKSKSALTSASASSSQSRSDGTAAHGSERSLSCPRNDPTPHIMAYRDVNAEMPLEYTVGAVRSSTMDLYFPNFLWDSEGSCIVSNIVCVANITESSSLYMRMEAKNEMSGLVFHPSSGVVVQPAQRAYFSVSWNVFKASELPKKIDGVQLLISSDDGFSKPPVTFNTHLSNPKGNAIQAPYHYWVNTTCITNRPVCASRELPFIRCVLPVFRIMMMNFDVILKDPVPSLDMSNTTCKTSENDKCSTTSVIQKDMDTHNLVHGMTASSVSNNGVYHCDPNSSLQTSKPNGVNEENSIGLLKPAAEYSSTNANVSVPTGGLLSRITGIFSSSRTIKTQHDSIMSTHVHPVPVGQGIIRNRFSETCRCLLTIGTINGFPMMFSSSTREGIAPSFKITVVSLEPRWQVENKCSSVNEGVVYNFSGETTEVYQTLSGSLKWSGEDSHVYLMKHTGAPLSQFLRMILMEVSPLDRDDIPVASAVISMNSLIYKKGHFPLSIPFYVLDTFSLYDELSSSSLVMKKASIRCLS